jgi:PLP dependent protein
LKVQKVLIEVNIGREPQKNGVLLENAAVLVEQVRSLPNLELLGLMSMAPYPDDPEQSRPYFREMKKLFDTIGGLTVLSMGMSGDYRIALAEGATMVRIGSRIFE